MAKRRGNHEGTIYKRGNSWAAQVSLEGRRLTKTFSSQKECQAWIRDMANRIDRGYSYSGSKLTVGEYLDIWLNNYRSSIRPKTLYQYKGIVNNHLKPGLGDIRLSEMRPDQIQDFYTLLLEQGKSKRTVQLIHSVLRRAFVIAERQGLIIQNPAKSVDPPKISHKEIQILDDNQVRQFMITARGSRFKSLYYLAVTTGMRQGELLGLKWIDVDWAMGTIHIRRQLQRVVGEGLRFSVPKTRAGIRIVDLGSEAMRRLIAQRKHQDEEAMSADWEDYGLVFPSMRGTPLDAGRLRHDFKRILRRANLPVIRFHDLRHTAASLMLLNGIPSIVVSRRLGHSKPSVTLDIYGHYLPGMQSTAAALMDELASPIAVKLQQIAARSPIEEI